MIAVCRPGREGPLSMADAKRMSGTLSRRKVRVAMRGRMVVNQGFEFESESEDEVEGV